MEHLLKKDGRLGTSSAMVFAFTPSLVRLGRKKRGDKQNPQKMNVSYEEISNFESRIRCYLS
ncbi:hypothetical protein CHS0354_027998 [Potamilus streckersoni]|uniref:Uncharacterized protein n=1 Tax=Potamilus streckersoni TaxID=2493646 RepID=A0AAE0W802_9BIVA|nr:hypothetical protein CHS0354_027998 [Potamilus streckersoni]